MEPEMSMTQSKHLIKLFSSFLSLIVISSRGVTLQLVSMPTHFSFRSVKLRKLLIVYQKKEQKT